MEGRFNDAERYYTSFNSNTLMKPIKIIRYSRVDKKQCSLTALEGRADLKFHNEKAIGKVDFNGCVLLHPDGVELSEADKDKSIILVDAHWKKAMKIVTQLEENYELERRGITGFSTAFPRTKGLKGDPVNGLRSCECLWVVKKLLGERDDSLLENYYFREEFFERNKEKIAVLEKL